MAPFISAGSSTPNRHTSVTAKATSDLAPVRPPTITAAAMNSATTMARGISRSNSYTVALTVPSE